MKNWLEFGTVAGMMLLSFVLLEGDDTFDFNEAAPETFDQDASKGMKRFREKLAKDQTTYQRYLSVFDAMKDKLQ